jgi:glycyl-tRNA synthetase beta chain
MAELLFEIGTEELPARFLSPACSYWESALSKGLREKRLPFQSIHVEASPRRTAVMIEGLATKQDDVKEEVSGPKASIAWDDKGELTKAGAGFLRGRGLTATDAYRKETPKGEVIAARVHDKGKPASDLLPTMLKTLMGKVPFPKTMRWTDGKETFGRPIRWLVCILDGETIDLEYAGVKSTNKTTGHRFHHPEQVEVSSIASYQAALDERQVVLAHDQRRDLIEQQANALAKEAGGQLLDDAALLDIVSDLVEKPWPLIGHFNETFLSIPKELLLSEMREHQKYFAVVNDDGELLPHFIVVAGSKPTDPTAVAAGHSRVLRSRFEDGAFYYEADLKESLEDRVPRLDSVLFQRDLGSLLDKTNRIKNLVKHMTEVLGLDASVAVPALQAAELCKADLVSGVVGEFPELQGVMGRYYAVASDLSVDVAQAIEEHYSPRHAGAPLPRNEAGALVAMADRLDTIVGIMGIGKAPTGNTDPFGLRRAAIAFLHIAMDRGYVFSLSETIEKAVSLFEDRPAVSNENLAEQVAMFFRVRLRSVLVEKAESESLEGVSDIVDSTIAAGFDDQVDLLSRTVALARMRAQDPDAFVRLAATFKRVGNILTKAREDKMEIGGTAQLEQDWTEAAEKNLAAAVLDVQNNHSAYKKSQQYEKILESVSNLKPQVDAFFDDVMVMVDDVELRTRRLAILASVEHILLAVADFSKVQIEQE